MRSVTAAVAAAFTTPHPFVPVPLAACGKAHLECRLTGEHIRGALFCAFGLRVIWGDKSLLDLTISGGIALRLPPRSGFVIGNLLSCGGGGTGSGGGGDGAGGVGGTVTEGLAPLLAAGRRFGIITLDPPWPSRKALPRALLRRKVGQKRQWERSEPGDEGALQLPDDSASNIPALPPAPASLAALPLRGFADDIKATPLSGPLFSPLDFRAFPCAINA